MMPLITRLFSKNGVFFVRFFASHFLSICFFSLSLSLSHFLSLPVFQLLFRRFRIVKSISEQDDDAVYFKKTACCDTNENNNYHRRIIIIIVLFVLSSVDDHLSILFYFYLWILKKSEDPLETFYEMDIILVIL